MEEVWKDIEGYEGSYKISNYGDVYGCRNKELVRQYITSHGYHYVFLRAKNGKNVRELVHQLVADAFIENKDNYQNIFHKDGDKANNSIENLERGRYPKVDMYKDSDTWRTLIYNGVKYPMFEVSNTGRLRNINTGTEYKQHSDKGYYGVYVSNGSEGCMLIKIHRAVAETFIPNPENKPQVNHIDGIPENNNVNNLEWATRSENMQHAWNHGLVGDRHGERNPHSKLTDKQREYIKDNCIVGDKEFGYSALAKKFGVTSGCIRYVVTGKR